MGLCSSKLDTKAKEVFISLDEDGSNTISRKEMTKFIEAQPELWAMLGVNLGIDEKKCREIASKVAYDLANEGHDERRSSVSANEFHLFWSEYIGSPKGQQEFFHRTVFAVFDADGNGYLDPNELDKLLDTFYEAGSIFKGDARLPKDKDTLKRIVTERLDVDKDGKLSFEEIRMLISGSANLT